MALYKTDENGKLIKIAGYGKTDDFATKEELNNEVGQIQTIITDSSVRIWDLPSGTYILPHYCKIYYNGATDTTKYDNALGDRTILQVNTSNDGAEKFFKFEYTTGWNSYYQYYLFTGMTTATEGFRRGFDFNARYPVGAYYISDNTTSPASIFGGSWEPLPEGYTLWTTSTANANAGTPISAGLPNIKGTFASRASTSNHNNKLSGAFYSVSSASGGPSSGSSGGENVVGFNANNYSSIYKDDVTTVQPPAYRVYVWRRTS